MQAPCRRLPMPVWLLEFQRGIHLYHIPFLGRHGQPTCIVRNIETHEFFQLTIWTPILHVNTACYARLVVTVSLHLQSTYAYSCLVLCCVFTNLIKQFFSKRKIYNHFGPMDYCSGGVGPSEPACRGGGGCVQAAGGREDRQSPRRPLGNLPKSKGWKPAPFPDLSVFFPFLSSTSTPIMPNLSMSIWAFSAASRSRSVQMIIASPAQWRLNFLTSFRNFRRWMRARSSSRATISPGVSCSWLTTMGSPSSSWALRLIGRTAGIYDNCSDFRHTDMVVQLLCAVGFVVPSSLFLLDQCWLAW